MGAMLPFSPVLIESQWYPSENSESEMPMIILEDFPRKAIRPCGFVEGSSATLKSTVRHIQNYLNNPRNNCDQFQESNKRTLDDWHLFEAEMPGSDNVHDYLKTHPDKFHFPLINELFCHKPVLTTGAAIPPVNVRRRNFKGKDVCVLKAQASIEHTGNKGKAQETTQASLSSLLSPESQQNQIIDWLQNNEYKKLKVKPMKKALESIDKGKPANTSKETLYRT